MVFGISGDSPAANAAYAKQLGLSFPLLSDTNLKVLKQFGVPVRLKQVGGIELRIGSARDLRGRQARCHSARRRWPGRGRSRKDRCQLQLARAFQTSVAQGRLWTRTATREARSGCEVLVTRAWKLAGCRDVSGRGQATRARRCSGRGRTLPPRPRACKQRVRRPQSSDQRRSARNGSRSLNSMTSRAR